MAGIYSPTSYRYERKFLVSHISRSGVESIIRLHPAMFAEIYQQRYVNNIYFDTVNASHYYNNVDGVSNRLKVRIRWYDDLFGFIEEPALELKTKTGFLGGKIRFSLSPFQFDTCHTLESQQRIFRTSSLPRVLEEDLKLLQFALVNRYRRRYYESVDHNYRITIDSDMEFFRIDSNSNYFLHKAIDKDNTIIELKYSDEYDENARMITNHFPFRMTKSSKYAMGIEKLYALV